MLKEGRNDSSDIDQPVIVHSTHTEELFVNCNGEALTYNHATALLELLGDSMKRLARIGITEGACINSDHWYFVACWDPETMAFIKKTLVARGKEAEKCVSILGNSWGEVDLSYEVLENICTIPMVKVSQIKKLPVFRYKPYD